MMERDHPALNPLGSRRVGEHGKIRFRDAGQLGGIGDLLEPGVGCVEHRAPEIGRELRQLQRNVGIARALLGLQRNAGKREVANRVFHGRAIGQRQIGKTGGGGQSDEHVIEITVLAQPRPSRHQQPVSFRMHRPQCGTVGHALQVRHRRPQRVDCVGRALERHPHRSKAGRPGADQCVDHRILIGDRLSERWQDGLGRQRREGRQTGRIGQRCKRHRVAPAIQAATSARNDPNAAFEALSCATKRRASAGWTASNSAGIS